ncbi:MAG: hypothetical protein B7Z12_19995 [Caulobacter vibrioides]|uniref:Putative auto-transporter adhesin head GIN domain-containing protein n=1 Tax=Caulobacter vibrioides TaxID=155892 RepID=A0A258CTD7_CAUVI|nr:MAG: hypothetical protein B7Z12_19995 [Caulobacter vibrioides]
MRALTTLAVLAIASTAAGAAAAAPSLKIKDAVVRVVIIPENRPDVKVEFLTTNAALPLTVRQDGEQVVIDGDLRMNRINGCNSRNGKVWVKVRGVGEVSYENMPQIAVRMPMNVKVNAGGAVFGDIGRSDSIDLGNAGCGDWTIANTKGKLEVAQAGSGGAKAGTSSQAEFSIAGSGDVSAQAVTGDLETNIAGSGDIWVASVNGKFEANIAGSGNITVAGGRSRAVDVSVMGSGDVTFNGEAADVDVSVMGSGDVKVARATGPVKKHVGGSGDVIIGQ